MKGIVAGVIAGTLLAALTPAAVLASGAGWKVHKLPNPSGAGTTQFIAISCSSAKACTAVGDYYDPGTNTYRTLAERGSAGTWSIQPTPSPTGLDSSFSGVSCPTAAFCLAVGSGTDSLNNIHAFAELWDGTSWSLRTVPVPAGSGQNFLNGVSCVSASSCEAVGGADNLTLAEVWDGSGWTIQSTQNPSGPNNSGLVGVSCISSSACTAAGSYFDSSNTNLTLVEVWNGSGWTIQPSPNVSGAPDNFLYSVSCASATACVAVGHYFASNSAPAQALMLVRSGSSWTITTAAPSGGDADHFYGVMCISVTACAAVGEVTIGADHLNLVEHWNGANWSTQPTPSPNMQSQLRGVWCSSATVCTGAGYYANSSGTDMTFVANGPSWVIENTPNPGGATNSLLRGVSCVSTKACFAVGNSDSVTLAEHWNGSAWAVQPTLNPSGAQNSLLLGASCTSTSACMAVGYDTNSSGVAVTLAEAWNGTGWGLQVPLNPSGAQNSVLFGVSCSSSTACTAVGGYFNSGGTLVTLAEVWNGSGWGIQSTPNPSGATKSFLNGVSCLSATFCIAAGYYVNSGGTQVSLAEVWNGTSWAVQSSLNPSGGTFVGFNGVSCTGTTACIAVGSYNSGSTGLNLAEVWNGSVWTIQSVPATTGATFNTLAGVSCSTASACTAAGSEISAGVSSTVAESWNGKKWSIQPTPTLAGATSSLFEGVSCASAKACTAVGYTTDGTGHDLTVGER